MRILGRPLTFWLAAAICLGTLGLLGIVAAGFFGHVHPGFDSISHFRLHLAAGAAVAAIILFAFKGWRMAAAALLALTLLPVYLTTGLPRLPNGGSAIASPAEMPVYRLLHLNLRFDNPETGQVFSMIGRERPDVISLAEVSASWEPRLEALRASYPYWVRCEQDSRNGGVALLSRRPFADGTEGSCHDRGSLALASIDFGGRTVDVGAMHIGWPWPFGQDWQVGNIAEILGELGDTAILGGDFNAAPWSAMAQQVAEGGGLRFARWVGPTWLDRRLPDILRPYIGLPIDHILVKGDIIDAPPRRLPEVGSDHLPLLMEFSLLPREPERTVNFAAR